VYPFVPRKLTRRQWLGLGAVWLLASFSLATQLYFNELPRQPQTGWLLLFAKQLPLWLLCALLTPFVMGVYRRFPLDAAAWKANLGRHLGAALCLLPLFSLLRMLTAYALFKPSLFGSTMLTHFANFMSQLSWDAGIYAFIVVVLFAGRTYQARKAQELSLVRLELRNAQLQQQLTQSQLEALQLQLSPHFLFNTLHTVGSLIRARQYEAAVEVNARLGEFLRRTLSAEHRPLVSLAAELEFADLYLHIESERFKDRLTVSRDIDPASLAAQVPHLILQPLLENAVRHGIARYRNARRLTITTHRDGAYVAVTIYNDAGPLPAAGEAGSGHGVGLRNVQSRLEKIYAHDFTFSLAGQADGVSVSLRLPVRAPAYANPIPQPAIH
jgi:sensor histidine kinase YesM